MDVFELLISHILKLQALADPTSYKLATD
uniref:Uncharacterized protein n=1 Tax=Rhizophora mucronata TaxID=61149 RepID=A0A2P2PPQ6_RHIMU